MLLLLNTEPNLLRSLPKAEKTEVFKKNFVKDTFLSNLTVGKKVHPLISITLRKFDILHETTRSAFWDRDFAFHNLHEEILKEVVMYGNLFDSLMKPKRVDSIRSRILLRRSAIATLK